MPRNRTTTRAMEEMVFGNGLFDRAVLALGIDRSAASHLIVELAAAVGAEPKSITIGQFTRMLPELGRRLRLLVPEAQAERSLEKLRQLVVQWID
jgi:hypothetical protein